MTAIAHSAIVAKVVELLSNAATLSTVTVYRNRLRPIPEAQTRAIVVRKASSDPTGDPLLGQGVDWFTQVRVECYARGSADETAEEIGDEMLGLVHAVMALPANQTLGGLCMGIGAPRLGWEEGDLDTTLGASVAQYPVQHRTAPNSLESAS